MDILTQAVALIDALAWPSVVLIAAYQFRSEVRALINRVVNDSEEVTMFGVSAKFGEAKQNLSQLDVPDEEKKKFNNLIDDIALSQIKDLSKYFYSSGVSQRKFAAKAIADIGLEIELERVLDLSKSKFPGERIAAAIALRKHIERDYLILENSDLGEIIEKGLKDERSRVRYRFVELVVGNSVLSEKFQSNLSDMALTEDNSEISQMIMRSMGYY